MDQSKQYLLSPSTSLIAPPINAMIDELPIEQLSWEDFERLCLRLVQINYAMGDCEIYGVKGQKQDGIDVFARVSQGQYQSYQCKKYQKVLPADLEKAVEEFKKGKWYDKSIAFYFCTTFPLNRTELQDKFNELKDDLAKQNIDFIKWDKIQICRQLKKQPQIVYDFFGREWVKGFNGKEQLSQINQQRKLDAQEVIHFRKKLYDFYATVFNQYDVGLSIAMPNNSYTPLQDRFIMPEAFETIQDTFFSFKEKQHLPHEEQNTDAKYQGQYALDMLLPQYEREQVANKQQWKQKVKEELPFPKLKSRTPVNALLTNHQKIMIIGDPGVGKSTLLRNLVLDLLAEKPQYFTVQHWNKCLPLWLPFAFLTKNLANNEHLNIEELLRIWFDSLNNAPLFDVAKTVLQDERLLLIVDGIDELNHTSAAQKAISLLEIYAEQHQIGIIYSSRLYGYKLLADCFQQINEVHLLPFSEQQQKQFITFWYQAWFSALDSQAKPYRKLQEQQFFQALQQSNELKLLAGNPLLLSILIGQKLRDAHLSSNKVKAIKAITKYLIDIHPQKRITAANIIKPQTMGEQFEFELTEVFEALAIHIQKHTPNGLIEKKKAVRVFTNYLTQWLDYPKPKAKKITKQILQIGAKDFGIIVEKTNEDIAFSHRLFQEFLAACYLINSEEGNDVLLSTYGGDPNWHQVIKFYFQLIPPRKTKQFEQALAVLGVKQEKKAYSNSLLFLKYDIVLTSNNVPPRLAQQYFHKITADFEYETDDRKKQIYWEIILAALSNTKIKQEVQSFLFGYFPNCHPYSDDRVAALKQVPIDLLSATQKAFLIQTLINGNVHQKLAASYTIRHFIDDTWLCDKVLDLLDHTTNLSIIPFALNAIITEKVTSEIQLKYIEQFKTIEHPETELFLIKLKVFLNIQDEEEYKKIWYLAYDNDAPLQNECLQLLRKGWTGNKKLMKTCLKKVTNKHYYEYDIEDTTSWKILFSCFPQEQKVVNAIIRELEIQKEPFKGSEYPAYDTWRYLVHYFKGNQQLIPVVESWMAKQTYGRLTVALISKIGRTEKIKQCLMQQLLKPGTGNWCYTALIDEYSDQDDVISFLKDHFKNEETARSIATYEISRVFKNDKTEGIKILRKIIQNAEFIHSKAIMGLMRLDSDYFKDNILNEKLLQKLSETDDVFGESKHVLINIIKYYKEEAIIKKYVEYTLAKNPAYTFMIISTYPKWIGLIDKILTVSKTLAVDYRIALVEQLGAYPTIQDSVEQLALYNLEKNKQIKATAAIKYFQYLLHHNRKADLIEMAEKNVFYRDLDYDIQRQLAFCAYLLAKELPQYFTLTLPEYKERAAPFYHFDSNIHPITATLIIDHFEDLYQAIDGQFELLTNKFDRKHKPQEYWSLWAKHSKKSSPSTPYILDYIRENEAVIEELHLFTFLERVQPNSPILKRICLRWISTIKEIKSTFAAIILGKHFSQDEEVYTILNDLNHWRSTDAKLLALCIGWEDAPILKEKYQQLEQALINNKSHEYSNKHLFYHLLLLYRNIEAMMAFFRHVFNEYNYQGLQQNHQYFINPLMRRLKKDSTLQEAIKQALLNSTVCTEKASFYALLQSIHKIDEAVLAWKEQELAKGNLGYGYNIVNNQLEHLQYCLTDVVYFN